jgi:3-isopropylmalate dehydratase small subunit
MSLPEMISGRVWKLGDHVNTDVIHPSSYFSLDEKRVKEGVLEGMERLGSHLNKDSLAEGIIIVAGENVGCGSSRETSVRGLRGSGVKAVVAASFARIFRRSLTNLNIPPLECREIQKFVKDGDLIRIFLREGWIEWAESRRIPFSPIDPHIRKILEAGGLIPYLRREKDEI